MDEVFRQEQKYLISYMEYKKHSAHFEKILQEDKHNKTNGYRIRSLYFDTIENRDFFDKEIGTEIRRKIRLRLYDPNGKFVVLEMKQKQGVAQRKRSLYLEKADAILISKGIYSPLLKYNSSFAAECFSIMNTECYRPKSIVEYNRKAFVTKENKIRITFDSSIEATESNLDIFSNNLNLNPVLDKFLVILEVKYNGFLLSYVQDVINQINKSTLSVSKYCLGRSISLKYIF